MSTSTEMDRVIKGFYCMFYYCSVDMLSLYVLFHYDLISELPSSVICRQVITMYLFSVRVM